MSATNYAVLVSRLQIKAADTETSNPHLGEVPSGQRNGTNKIFRLSYQNPVVIGIFLTYGAGIIRQPAGANTFQILDGPTGYITVTPGGIAPDSGSTQPFYFDYFSQLFTQADYQSMLDEGTDWLAGLSGVPAGTDLPEGLYPAQVQYALHVFYTRRVSALAKEYASSGGGIGAQPQTPAQTFMALAKAALAQAITYRDDYYKDAGQRNQPFSGSIHYPMSTGQSPY